MLKAWRAWPLGVQRWQNNAVVLVHFTFLLQWLILKTLTFHTGFHRLHHCASLWICGTEMMTFTAPLGDFAVWACGVVRFTVSQAALGKQQPAREQINAHAHTKYTNTNTCMHKLHSASQKKCKTQTRNDTKSRGNAYISFVGPQACWAPASAETNTVAIIERTNIIKNVETFLV